MFFFFFTLLSLLLMCSWYTLLFQSLLYSKGNQLNICILYICVYYVYVCVNTFFIMVYARRLDIVPCATQ